jgi:uncharacterized protein
MPELIHRPAEMRALQTLLADFPVVAILGPRQSGKTTLAGLVKADHYLDLEDPRAARRMENPLLTLEPMKGLVVIDEVQRLPELFPILRSIVDRRLGQRFLLLGSASGDLIRHSSESLAGRVAYLDIGGLRAADVGTDGIPSLWLRGALPPAFTARSDEASWTWRQNYVRTFLERDIPQLGITIPAATLRRFWEMLSHYHGQILNWSELARSFGVSDTTVRRYVDILQGTFMVRVLQPWYVNVGKRLVKAPKLYLRDSGILHALQAIDTRDQLLSHPKLGASWEGFVIEEVSKALRAEALYYWRTHTGAEMDLTWQRHGKRWGVEVKWADAPAITPSIRNALVDLELEHVWVVYPGTERYRLSEQVTALPAAEVREPWPYPGG